MPQTYAEPAIGVISADVELTPWPIPAEQITGGAPDARGAVISRSADSRILRGVWRCTPGAFDWHFGWDETLVVLEGEATIEMDTGEVIELRPGVTAFFGRDHDSKWTVHSPILKGFHIDSPEALDL